MTIHRDVRGSRIERRRIDLADAAPFRPLLRRYVCPILPFVSGELDQAVIRAYPDQALGDWGFSQSKDGVVILGAGIIERNVAAGNFLFAFVVARQVGT